MQGMNIPPVIRRVVDQYLLVFDKHLVDLLVDRVFLPKPIEVAHSRRN